MKLDSQLHTETRWLRDLVARNRQGEHVGVFSVCSAHPAVIEAAMRHAARCGRRLLIESTSNQVNQFGGYTGMNPIQFRDHVESIAGRLGLDPAPILLGGDHLGPYPWRKEPSANAMDNAIQLVRECVLAGYGKIHLDASMACADDPEPLSNEAVAQRAARMCRAAEEAKADRGSSDLVYVIGTEVPVPGGEQLENQAPLVTRIEDMRITLDITRAAFLDQKLDDAWERVVGLVVQPGVEFGDAIIFDYDHTKAQALAAALPATPHLVYEAHSTDYQKASGLRALVEDHFAILKVGPWLTFAFREAIFALSAIEREWLGDHGGIRLSQVREALEHAMLRNPEHWKSYYSGSEQDQKFARIYSFSDRCRYYWPDPAVQQEVSALFRNLAQRNIPRSLISQCLPDQYQAVREGRISATPDALVDDHIAAVLRQYAAACG